MAPARLALSLVERRVRASVENGESPSLESVSVDS